MRDEIVYGVIPRNVGPDGLRSVAKRMPDWQDLGVTALWISPINATPPGNYGYAVTDYFALRDDVGTEQDLRELVTSAHRHGIRVLLDFVPNHSSTEHPFFADARARGPRSPHYDFYDRDEEGTPTHYFSWVDLPNLNFDNPDVERHITDAFCHWVREFDIDGYRVDVAWGIRQRKPEFWPRLRRALQEVKPDVLLVAEASARDAYYCANGFDAAYDWNDELGHAAWEHVFDQQDHIVPRLHSALTNEGRGYSDHSRIFRFLNNNDTAARFVTRHGVDLTRVATALLLTLPGVPCVYVGDEVGAEFEPYRDAGAIDWVDRHGLRPFHRRLIGLRKAVPSLRGPGWHPLPLAGSPQQYGYVRSLEDGSDPVLVLLNFSADSAEPDAVLPPQFRELAGKPFLTDLLTDERFDTAGTGRLRIPLKPWSARVLR